MDLTWHDITAESKSGNSLDFVQIGCRSRCQRTAHTQESCRPSIQSFVMQGLVGVADSRKHSTNTVHTATRGAESLAVTQSKFMVDQACSCNEDLGPVRSERVTRSVLGVGTPRPANNCSYEIDCYESRIKELQLCPVLQQIFPGRRRWR
jgi:hypothetical protein